MVPVQDLEKRFEEALQETEFRAQRYGRWVVVLRE
jgi:hypothetical protein